MTERIADNKVKRKQIRGRVNELMEKNLYRLTDEELAPFMLKNGLEDPDFFIDHPRVDDNGDITQHPYNMSMKRMKNLIEWCEQHGYDFRIIGASEYFPAATFKIVFRKSELRE